jgi:dTMP kinase
MNRLGRFISFEGGEGAGKSTQIRRLADRLADAGIDAITTREPGGTEGAEAIRSLVTEGAADRWSPLTETLLFVAARQDHVERLIRPALDGGTWVLCDRFMDSTRVYQGVAGTLGLEKIDQLHRSIFGDMKPDLTLVLDLPVKAGLARRHGSGEINRFDRMVTSFHDDVRQGFLNLAKAEPARFGVVDAMPSEDEVAEAIWELIDDRWPDISGDRGR